MNTTPETAVLIFIAAWLLLSLLGRVLQDIDEHLSLRRRSRRRR